jgi:sugar/nucleoside kinase (ribokinase family)
MLANITSISRAVGGCAPNTSIDLAKIDGSIPMSVIGCVGDDEYGRYVISQMQRYNIDTGKVVVTEKAPTSFSDVMSMPSGERTFFHARGANALFNPEHINIADLQCSMLHIGYILLLDRFDAEDPEYGTVMARFLHDVQAYGIKTSIDVVSDSTGQFARKVIPALKYSDYVIINEIECCSIWDCSPRNEDGSLNVPVLKDAMQRTMDCGVGEKVVVHSKEAGFCLSKDGSFTAVPSLEIPAAEIKGSVGAGDAYCAGCLYGLYNHFTDEEMLKFASAAAACNLFAENAVDGMRSKNEILEVMGHYPRKTI